MAFFEEFASSTDADRRLLLRKNDIELYQFSHYQYVCSGEHFVQGAMDSQAPSHVQSSVVDAMLAGLQLRRPLSSVLNLGLGCAAIERYLTAKHPALSVVTVDYSQDVIDLCAEAGLLPAGCAPVKADAAQFLLQTTLSFDAIFCDLAVGNSQPELMFTKFFYSACRQRMNAGAVLMVNVLCADNETLSGVCLAARKVFAWTSVLVIPGFDNAVLYAADTAPAIEIDQRGQLHEPELKTLLSSVRILP